MKIQCSCLWCVDLMCPSSFGKDGAVCIIIIDVVALLLWRDLVIFWVLSYQVHKEHCWVNLDDWLEAREVLWCKIWSSQMDIYWEKISYLSTSTTSPPCPSMAYPEDLSLSSRRLIASVACELCSIPWPIFVFSMWSNTSAGMSNM